MKPLPERNILASCLRWLEDHRVYAWRNSTGTVQVQGRWISFGKVGSSDILGVLDDGRILCIETKAEKGRLSREQKEFLAAIEARGGCAIVARNVDDLERELGDQQLLFAGRPERSNHERL